jgi:PAS domain S-box-containing protein
MDLKGLISQWSAAAEALYGYTAADMQGKSVAKLFESESEITRLYKDLMENPQTVFQTTHRSKDGTIFRVRIEFRPVMEGPGKTVAIGLICSRR